MNGIIGYVYCMSNASMPGIYKVGMTERTPEERLYEANQTDTWRPPTPYELEIVERVKNPREVENTLHKNLEKYRIHPKREFFQVSLLIIQSFFNTIDSDKKVVTFASIYSKWVLATAKILEVKFPILSVENDMVNEMAKSQQGSAIIHAAVVGTFHQKIFDIWYRDRRPLGQPWSELCADFNTDTQESWDLRLLAKIVAKYPLVAFIPETFSTFRKWSFMLLDVLNVPGELHRWNRIPANGTDYIAQFNFMVNKKLLKAENVIDLNGDQFE